jgi:dolichol-phosphate mannosyltransferase
MQGSVRAQWSLSLVIPAFNEEAGIARAIAEADAALHSLAEDYEILVVDDGSSDQTFSIAKEQVHHHPKVRVLRHECNRGYGAALRTGFEAAQFDHVAFTDADCQFDLHDLGRLVPLAEQAPIIVGYRQNRQDPWRRKFLSRGYNFLARLLLGTRVRDCDCALKVFRRDALSHLLPESANFFVNTEMLARARQQSLNVIEAPVQHRPRQSGRSKVSLTDVPKTLATLLPFWWSRVLFPHASPSQPHPHPLYSEAVERGGNRPMWEVFVLLALAAVFFFCRLHSPLLEPEEGRYAEIPRQMLAEGHWLVPVLHGEPYLDKPPLLYWLVMTCYQVFGVHDWAARIVPGLAGFLTIVVSYFWARRTVGLRAAFLGSGILCLSAEFIYYGRMLTMNGLLALFVTAALACSHFSLLTPSRRKQLLWMALAGLACGLGLLTKGPVILALILPPLFAVTRLDRRLRRPGGAGWGAFAVAAILVGAPWYIAMCLRQPVFAGYFFWKHNVTRFVQPFDHSGPVWEYLPGLLLGMMPWTLLVPPLAASLFPHAVEGNQRRPPAMGLFLLSFLWMFGFFCLSGSKRPAYIVPVLPSFALVLGCYLDSLLGTAKCNNVLTALQGVSSRLAYLAAAIMLASGAGLAAWAWKTGLAAQGWSAPFGIACGVGLAFLLARAPQRRCSWLLPALATGFVMLVGIHNLLPEYARRFSMRHPIAMLQHRVVSPETTVLCYPHRFDSTTFYLRQRQVSAYGNNQRADLIAILEANPQAVLIVQTRHLPELLAALPPTLEFETLEREDLITIGEVHRRNEAPQFWLAQRSHASQWLRNEFVNDRHWP